MLVGTKAILTLCMVGYVASFMLSSADFFSKINFFIFFFAATLTECQTVWINVGPDLDLNCQQRLSADDTSYYKQCLLFEKTYLIVIKDETGLK